MWEFILIIYNFNIYGLLQLTNNFFYKNILLYLNHLYFSFFFISFLYLIKNSSNIIFLLFNNFLIYKFIFLELQNFMLLKYAFFLSNTYHFFFELLVGLVFIHPVLFYFGLLNLITIIINQFFFKNIIWIYSLILNFLLLSIAFFLGGLWGWLNFSWGYIWVYDYIEYLLLILVIFHIYQFHTKIFRKYIITNILFLTCLILFYILLRYNFLPTRHAFFSKISFTMFKQVCCSFFLLNYLTTLNTTLILSIFFLKPIWSFFLTFISSLILSWYLINSYVLINFFLKSIHLLIFYIISFMWLHTSNYYYNYNFINYIFNKIRFITNYSIINHKILFNFSIKRKILKNFKNNFFTTINYFYVHTYNFFFTIQQIIPDINAIFNIIILIIFLFWIM